LAAENVDCYKIDTPMATYYLDNPGPEWIAFGDVKLDRVLVLVHHEDDHHPDPFHQMDRQMTVFGFGRRGLTKYLDRVPQRVSIAFLETTRHERIDRTVRQLLAHGPAERND